MTGSIKIKCPVCGEVALCSPSKGVWCCKCKGGKQWLVNGEVGDEIK